MCRTSGDDGSSVSSRSTSDSSDHSEVLPLMEALPSFDKSSKYHAAGGWPPPRATRGAVVALVCALSAAVSLSLFGGCVGGLLCWTNSSQGGEPDGSKLLKMREAAPEEVSTSTRSTALPAVAKLVALRISLLAVPGNISGQK